MREERGRRELRGDGREGAAASRRASWFWVLAFIVFAALAVAAPLVYKRYFMTPEAKARMEADTQKLRQKLREIKEGVEKRIPAELEKLEQLADKLKQKAGTVRDETLKELRERGLTPADLKRKIEELGGK